LPLSRKFNGCYQRNSADHDNGFAHGFDRRRGAQRQEIKVKSVNDFTSEDVEIEIKAPGGVSADQLVDALYAFTDCEVTIASASSSSKQPAGRDDGIGGAQGEHGAARGHAEA